MSTPQDSAAVNLLQDSSHIIDPITEYNVILTNTIYPADVNAVEDIPPRESSFGSLVSLDDITKDQRNWFSRTFSPVTPGSLRGSTFILISTALGAGFLSLPYMYLTTGVILGSIFLIVTGIASVWSMHLLSECSFRTKSSKYSEAVLKLLGPKWSLFLQFVLILYSFGSVLSYFITLNQFIGGIATSFGLITYDESQAWINPHSEEYYHTYIVIAIIALASLPLCAIKNLSGLRYLTIFGVMAICYILLIVVIQFPTLHSRLSPGHEVLFFGDGWSAVVAWGICAFSFTCHVSVFPVMSELQRPTHHRTTKIFNRSVTFEIIMYLAIGLSGYLSMLEDTPKIFVTRNAVVGPNDIFMTIGKIAMAINLYFVIPVNLNPCRLQILILLKKDKNPSKLLFYGLTTLLVAAIAGLATLFPNVYSVFGLLGGFFATLLAFSFPMLLYLKCTSDKPGHYSRILVYLIGITTTVLGFCSALVIILQEAHVIAEN